MFPLVSHKILYRCIKHINTDKYKYICVHVYACVQLTCMRHADLRLEDGKILMEVYENNEESRGNRTG